MCAYKNEYQNGNCYNSRREVQGDFIAAFHYLKEACSQEGMDFYTV